MLKSSFCPAHRLEKNNASILVICLWAITVLSIFAMALTSFVFQEIKFARSYRRIALSLPLARSALASVFYLREKDPTSQYDTMQELAREEGIDFCAGNSLSYYFVDKVIRDGNTEIIDEGALINLNTASIQILKRLPGVDEDLAESIANSGMRPFRSVNEVLLVEGMNKESFLLFKDLVTVYGAGRININTVSKGVLLALGLDNDLADAIIRFRTQNQIEPVDASLALDPVPDYGISTLSTLLDDLRRFVTLGLRQEQDLLSLLTTFDVRSEYLRFNVVTRFGEEKGPCYSIVIHPATKKVISWREE
ncbi:MAG: helix-hairpin-helix domain-containing protein [Candidatus Omnitrophica bacterium]|nr:helix-hairpin-helix domain-containing protein [Candidatus Omnitrophota bacterium]